MTNNFPFDDNQLGIIQQLIDSRVESALIERDARYTHPCGIHNWDIEQLRGAIRSLKPKDEFHAGQVFLLRLLDHYEECRLKTSKNPVHRFENFMDTIAASLDRDGRIDPTIDFKPDEYDIFRKVVPSINRRKVLVGAGFVGGAGIMGGAVVRGLDKVLNDNSDDEKMVAGEAASSNSEDTPVVSEKGGKPESFFERLLRRKSEAKPPQKDLTGWRGGIRSTSRTLEKLQPALEFTAGSVGLWYGLTEYEKARFEQVTNALERLLDQTRVVKRREDIESYSR